MDVHDEDRQRIAEALENGYMVLDTRGGSGRFFLELGEGRRVRQEWEQCQVAACPAATTTFGILRFEDLGGLDCSLRSDEITGMWEHNARRRAALRFLDDTIEAETKANKKWGEEEQD